VAKIASDAMDNYLMFDMRVRSTVLTDNIPPTILMGPRLIKNNPFPDRAKKALAKRMNRKLGEKKTQEFKVSYSISYFYLWNFRKSWQTLLTNQWSD
jgi:hypothetical protein